jgi:hypothetical protein
MWQKVIRCRFACRASHDSSFAAASKAKERVMANTIVSEWRRVLSTVEMIGAANTAMFSAVRATELNTAVCSAAAADQARVKLLRDELWAAAMPGLSELKNDERWLKPIGESHRRRHAVENLKLRTVCTWINARAKYFREHPSGVAVAAGAVASISEEPAAAAPPPTADDGGDVAMAQLTGVSAAARGRKRKQSEQVPEENQEETE